MKIGLIGDVHATHGPVREALAFFAREGVETILCPGDIAGYGDELEETVALLQEHGCLAVQGNHDVWRLDDIAYEKAEYGPVETYLRTLPVSIEQTVSGRRLAMVHASPPDSLMDGIKLLDEEGKLVPEQQAYWTSYLQMLPFDLLVVGHTHQVFAQWLGTKLVINPGSTRFNHTCAILTLPEMTVEFLALGERVPVLSWHWSYFSIGTEELGISNSPSLFN